MKKKKITLFRSVLWIFSSAIFINGTAYFGIKGYQYFKMKSDESLRVPIKAIVQTGPQKEALPTAYLAELLELSRDRPILTSEFDLKQAKENLLASPVIKQAEVKIYEPGILYVDYTTRQPVAMLLDYENVALDQDHTPFPLLPFFTPKKLPEIYLGLKEPISWNQCLTGEKIDLAYELFHTLNGPIVKELFNAVRIDVSHAFESSFGKREIVILTEDRIYTSCQDREICVVYPRILRLPAKKYSQELSNYLKLRENLLEKEEYEIADPDQQVVYAPTRYIDFRISQLAFIEED